MFIRERGPNNLRHSHSLISSSLIPPPTDRWMDGDLLYCLWKKVGRSVPLMVFTKCGGYLFPIHLSGSSSTPPSPPPPARLLSALLLLFLFPSSCSRRYLSSKRSRDQRCCKEFHRLRRRRRREQYAQRHFTIKLDALDTLLFNFLFPSDSV